MAFMAFILSLATSLYFYITDVVLAAVPTLVWTAICTTIIIWYLIHPQDLMSLIIYLILILVAGPVTLLGAPMSYIVALFRCVLECRVSYLWKGSTEETELPMPQPECKEKRSSGDGSEEGKQNALPVWLVCVWDDSNESIPNTLGCLVQDGQRIRLKSTKRRVPHWDPVMRGRRHYGHYKATQTELGSLKQVLTQSVNRATGTQTLYPFDDLHRSSSITDISDNIQAQSQPTYTSIASQTLLRSESVPKFTFSLQTVADITWEALPEPYIPRQTLDIDTLTERTHALRKQALRQVPRRQNTKVCNCSRATVDRGVPRGTQTEDSIDPEDEVEVVKAVEEQDGSAIAPLVGRSASVVFYPIPQVVEEPMRPSMGLRNIIDPFMLEHLPVFQNRIAIFDDVDTYESSSDSNSSESIVSEPVLEASSDALFFERIEARAPLDGDTAACDNSSIGVTKDAELISSLIEAFSNLFITSVKPPTQIERHPAEAQKIVVSEAPATEKIPQDNNLRPESVLESAPFSVATPEARDVYSPPLVTQTALSPSPHATVRGVEKEDAPLQAGEKLSDFGQQLEPHEQVHSTSFPSPQTIEQQPHDRLYGMVSETSHALESAIGSHNPEGSAANQEMDGMEQTASVLPNAQAALPEGHGFDNPPITSYNASGSQVTGTPATYYTPFSGAAEPAQPVSLNFPVQVAEHMTIDSYESGLLRMSYPFHSHPPQSDTSDEMDQDQEMCDQAEQPECTFEPTGYHASQEYSGSSIVPIETLSHPIHLPISPEPDHENMLAADNDAEMLQPTTDLAYDELPDSQGEFEYHSLPENQEKTPSIFYGATLDQQIAADDNGSDLKVHPPSHYDKGTKVDVTIASPKHVIANEGNIIKDYPPLSPIVDISTGGDEGKTTIAPAEIVEKDDASDWEGDAIERAIFEEEMGFVAPTWQEKQPKEDDYSFMDDVEREMLLLVEAALKEDEEEGEKSKNKGKGREQRVKVVTDRSTPPLLDQWTAHISEPSQEDLQAASALQALWQSAVSVQEQPDSQVPQKTLYTYTQELLSPSTSHTGRVTVPQEFGKDVVETFNTAAEIAARPIAKAVGHRDRLSAQARAQLDELHPSYEQQPPPIPPSFYSSTSDRRTSAISLAEAAEIPAHLRPKIKPKGSRSGGSQDQPS